MDTFGFESQYFDKGFGKVLNGLEQRVVSGLQQAASVVDEYPSQPQQQQGIFTTTVPLLAWSSSYVRRSQYVVFIAADLSDTQNTVAFWRLFDLQQRKQSLQEIKQTLQELHANSDSGTLQR